MKIETKHRWNLPKIIYSPVWTLGMVSQQFITGLVYFDTRTGIFSGEARDLYPVNSDTGCFALRMAPLCAGTVSYRCDRLYRQQRRVVRQWFAHLHFTPCSVDGWYR